MKLRVTGVVVDRSTFAFTRGGTPRAAFSLYVRRTPTTTLHYVVAYGTLARFCDRYIQPGQRLQVEGTSLPKQRFPRELVAQCPCEAVILAQSVREVQQKVSAKPTPNPALAAAATREVAQTSAHESPMSPAAAPLALTA